MFLLECVEHGASSAHDHAYTSIVGTVQITLQSPMTTRMPDGKSKMVQTIPSLEKPMNPINANAMWRPQHPTMSKSRQRREARKSKKRSREERTKHGEPDENNPRGREDKDPVEL